MNSFYGNEYPAAITFDGVRMPLATERRWTRTYTDEDGKTWHRISRFMDGSAAITFQELAREWPHWSELERQDFCGACSWLHKQADLPDMLRHIMEHGDPEDWSGIAGSVSVHLPRDEAFGLLTHALRSTDIVSACNIIQGIALTKHPEAESVLRAHLAALWSHPLLWDEDDFTNWLAYGATGCIQHLIEAGVPPKDFTQNVRDLARHACEGNRDSCRRFLGKYFPWLDDPAQATGNA